MDGEIEVQICSLFAVCKFYIIILRLHVKTNKGVESKS